MKTASSALDALLSRLQHVREVNGGYRALCPAHDDKNASLSVCEVEGRVLLRCHAGCDTAAVLKAVGLDWPALFDNDARRGPRETRKPVAQVVGSYDYCDAAGKLVFQVVRHHPKTFRQRRPDGRGGWLWNMDGVTRVPYRFPSVLEAVKSGETVFVVEGEKDVHTLEGHGLTATCNPGGAGKWLDSYSQFLAGANVVILPDNDKAGAEHAQDVAAKLSGVAASIKVVNLPGLPPKGDVSDWLAAGHTRDKLLELVGVAEAWTPPPHPTTPKPAPTDFKLTDLGNAERLIAAHGENLRFDVNSGQWLVWNGKRWEPDATGEVMRRAAEVIRGIYSRLPGLDKAAADALYAHAKKSESKPRLDAMVALAQHIEGVPVRASDLDADPMLLNCLNVTVNLRTGELQPHAREDLITKLAPVEYDPTAKAPRWERFLSEVFQGDEEIIGFVKRMVGYCLSGETSEQCLFVLTGKGANGKSTFLEVLRAILGDYAGNTPFSSFTERRDNNTSDLAALVGKRLVTASEGEEAQSFNESALKTCTGSDVITCRHLYREFFTYKPAFKLLFATNEVPRIRSQNYAMKRRIKLIPFRQRFYDRHENKQPVRDPHILDKLLAEKSGILAWAVRGYLEWQASGLKTPAAIQQEVDRLFESQDPLAEFLEEQCELRPGAEIETGMLWQRYKLWCETTGRIPAFKQPHFFSRALTQRDGIDTRKGTGGRRILTGIGFADTQETGFFERDSGASGAESVFSENPPMKGESRHFSEKGILAPLSATPERETEVSDWAEEVSFFDSAEDFDSLASLAPDPPEEDDQPPGLAYVCGACKSGVTLTDHKRHVYKYVCEACGHEGVLPHLDYELWLKRQAARR